jgi:hypothetical protein
MSFHREMAELAAKERREIELKRRIDDEYNRLMLGRDTESPAGPREAEVLRRIRDEALMKAINPPLIGRPVTATEVRPAAESGWGVYIDEEYQPPKVEGWEKKWKELSEIFTGPRAGPYTQHGDGTLELGFIEHQSSTPRIVVRLLYPDIESDDFRVPHVAWDSLTPPIAILSHTNVFKYYYSIPSDHPSIPPIHCYTKD